MAISFYGLGTIRLKAFLKNLWIVLVFFSNSNDNSANPSLILFMTDSLVDFLADFLMCVYFICGPKNIKFFFIRINSNEF